MSKIVVQLGAAIAAKLIAATSKAFVDRLGDGGFSISQPHAGAWWITSVDGKFMTWSGQVISLYYHPSKTHYATTIGKNGTKKSEAVAGEWAVSHQSRAMMGNKALYDTA